MTLTDFLLARIAEDEEVARSASNGPWGADHSPYASSQVASSDVWIAETREVNDAEHIARHDPARVLAECEAKRRIVKLVVDEGDALAAVGRSPRWQLAVLRLLALPYTDHSDYREEWRP